MVHTCIIGISSFLIDIGYLVVITCIDLVGYATITGTPCTPSVTVVKNCGIGPLWIGMPLLFNVVVASDALSIP